MMMRGSMRRNCLRRFLCTGVRISFSYEVTATGVREAQSWVQEQVCRFGVRKVEGSEGFAGLRKED